MLNACPGSTITFAGSVNLVTLTTAEILIDKSLTITGPGADLLTVQRSFSAGTPEFRIFNIPFFGLDITVSGMTVSNGRVPAGGAGVGSFQSGGGIRSASELVLRNVHVTGNHATTGGGGVYLVLDNGLFDSCTINGNTSGTGGAAILYQGDLGHTLRLVNSTISGNTSAGSVGGVYHVSLNAGTGGTVEIFNTTITGNTGTTSGGINTYAPNAGAVATTNVRSSIIANNSPNNLLVTPGSGTATTVSQGFNLSSDNGGGFLTQPTDLLNRLKP